jgi:hypothetical protein
MNFKDIVQVFGLSLTLAGCASQWKIQGGPHECRAMCHKWNMELTGMVGVGNQSATGPGATACVCQVRKTASLDTQGVAASGTSASTAAVIVAIQAAQQQQQQQSTAK